MLSLTEMLASEPTSMLSLTEALASAGFNAFIDWNARFNGVIDWNARFNGVIDWIFILDQNTMN